jgi:hypothetical protein
MAELTVAWDNNHFLDVALNLVEDLQVLNGFSYCFSALVPRRYCYRHLFFNDTVLSYVLFQVPCLKFLIPVTRPDVGRSTLCYWGCESWSVP